MDATDEKQKTEVAMFETRANMINQVMSHMRYVKQLRKESKDPTSSKDLLDAKRRGYGKFKIGGGISKSVLGPLNIRSYLNCYLTGNTNVS